MGRRGPGRGAGHRRFNRRENGPRPSPGPGPRIRRQEGTWAHGEGSRNQRQAEAADGRSSQGGATPASWEAEQQHLVRDSGTIEKLRKFVGKSMRKVLESIYGRAEDTTTSGGAGELPDRQGPWAMLITEEETPLRILRTDGGSRGNGRRPPPSNERGGGRALASGIGASITVRAQDGNEQEIWWGGSDGGQHSNNEAEYQALILGLQSLRIMGGNANPPSL